MDSSDAHERLKARIERLEMHLGLRPRGVNKPPFYGHTPSCGLHRLKEAWKQMKYLPAQCLWLIEELDLAMAATEELAPSRTQEQGFQLRTRIEQERPQSTAERRLEWDLYYKWGLKMNSSNANHDLFHRLVGFQVPLLDIKRRNGWDKIDLVGLDSKWDPVVIELKQENASDKPQRIIMEGVAYAIALKKVWPLFSNELAPLLQEVVSDITLSKVPDQFAVCLLAPEKYWNSHFTNYFGNPLYSSHKDILKELLSKLNDAGYPVKFGSITGHETDELNCQVWRPFE